MDIVIKDTQMNDLMRFIYESHLDILSESENVVIQYDKFTSNPNYGDKIFFNGHIIDSGEIDDTTKKIHFKKKNSSENFVFDIDKVKFAKKYPYSPFVSTTEFVKVASPNAPKNENAKLSVSEINQRFKDIVNKAIRDVYSTELSYWEENKGRGPSGKGGVVNKFTVGEILKKLEMDIEGGDWSIMNYFDTNPMVRTELFKNYGKKIETENDLEEFANWVDMNKQNLFISGDTLDRLVELNTNSFLNGVKNEKKAYDFVSKQLPPNFTIGSLNFPGSPKDRSGVDFSVFDKGREVETYQAKPFKDYLVYTSFTDSRYSSCYLEIAGDTVNVYRVYSYNISNLYRLTPKKVTNFIFASHSNKQGVIIFENKPGCFNIGTDDSKTKKGEYIDFYYPPINYDKDFN